MSKRDVGQEILEGIRDIKAHKAGKKNLRVHTLKEPAPPQVICAKLRLSQSAFAGLMGVSLRTVQDWGQGRVQRLSQHINLEEIVLGSRLIPKTQK